MSNRNLKIACVVLLLVQIFTGLYIFISASESGWGRFLLIVFGLLVIAWHAGLMVMTALILFKADRKITRTDFYIMLAVGVATFFTFGFTTGFIS